MTIKLKKQVFSHADCYEVFEHDETKIFMSESKMTDGEMHFHLYEPNGKEVAVVQERHPEIRPTFELFSSGKAMGVLYKEVSWQRKSYIVEIDDTKFDFSQKFIGNKVQISCDDSPCGMIWKDGLSWRETYTIEVNVNKSPLFFVAVLLVIIKFDELDEVVF